MLGNAELIVGVKLVGAGDVALPVLRFIAGISEETLSISMEKEVSGSRLTSEVAETPVESLDLSVRVFNSLKRTGIITVGDVLELLEDELLEDEHADRPVIFEPGVCRI